LSLFVFVTYNVSVSDGKKKIMRNSNALSTFYITKLYWINIVIYIVTAFMTFHTLKKKSFKKFKCLEL